MPIKKRCGGIKKKWSRPKGYRNAKKKRLNDLNLAIQMLEGKTLEESAPHPEGSVIEATDSSTGTTELESEVHVLEVDNIVRIPHLQATADNARSPLKVMVLDKAENCNMHGGTLNFLEPVIESPKTVDKQEVKMPKHNHPANNTILSFDTIQEEDQAAVIPAAGIHDASSSTLDCSVESGIYKVVEPTDSLNISSCSGFIVAGMELLCSPDKDKPEDLPSGVSHPTIITEEMSSHPTSEVPIYEVSSGESQVNGLLERQEGSFLQHDFMDMVRDKVSERLSIYWSCATFDDCINVVLTPKDDLFCAQRKVIVTREGSISIFVHGDSVPLGHELWSILPKPLQRCNSVEEFSQYVLCIVDHVRKYEVCRGNKEDHYGQFLKRMKGSMVLDSNRYKERTYISTYRSVNCFKLVTLRRLRCSHCAHLRRILGRRLKRLSKGTPKAKTNFRYLTTPQQISRNKKLVREKRCLEKTARRSLAYEHGHT